MALKRNMSANEMVDFLNKELLPQASLEIQNVIRPRKKQGGYFVTVRQILCMVDFLGAVYSGYPLVEREHDRYGHKIATSAKAIKFIKTFFKPDRIYNTNVTEQLYEMYRHGLVHLYQPKFLKLSGRKVLRWFFYKGKRNWKWMKIDTNQGTFKFHNINHLEINFNNVIKKDVYYLPICIDALYEDFKSATEAYRDKVKNTRYLQRNWRTAVNAIVKPR